MNSRFVVFILMVGILTTLAADTIPGGDVSGTWYAANSPYYISGNITLQANDTLIIEPSVEVNFLEGYYYFIVNGLLSAVGTETDSIVFTAGTSWWGLHFLSAPDSSHLQYCVLEEAYAIIYSVVFCYNSNPVISHCRISNNIANGEGGGITLYNSNPEIEYCDITGNTGLHGGGIRCHGGSTPSVSHCTISGNNVGAGLFGGGIAIEGGSHPVIDSCIIIDNHAVHGGGIAVLDGGSCTITNCIVKADSAHVSSTCNGGGIYIDSPGGFVTITSAVIEDCYSADSGGGLFIRSADSVFLVRSILDNNYSGELGAAMHTLDCSDLFIDHCDVVNNRSIYSPTGIMLNGATNLTLANCIFRNQDFYDIYFLNYTSAVVTYSDFYDWGGGGGPFGGNPPAGLGTLVQTNYNGDSCDVYYNIFLDPLFEDFPMGDYHLTSGSPCIDAGDPAYAYDPDSTITDMGAYWYDQRLPEIQIPLSLLDFGTVTMGDSSSLVLIIHNIGTGDLILYDMTNALTVFTNDWAPADSIVLPGDSLLVLITFTPDDSIVFTDTLWIDNNDTLAYVELLGVGEPPSGIAEDISGVGAPRLELIGGNPFRDKITISLVGEPGNRGTGESEIKIYDITGRLVLRRSLVARTSYLGADLKAGIYFIEVEGVVTQKVVKVR